MKRPCIRGRLFFVRWVWCDGRVGTWAPSDPAENWGEGVFTTLRVENGIPIWLSEHLQRLRHWTMMSGLPSLTLTDREVITFAQRMRGIGRLKLARTDQHQWMHLQPYQSPKVPLLVGIYPWSVQRHPIKSLNYIHRAQVRAWALSRGFDDALTVDEEGYLLEGSYSNLYWILGKQLITPPNTSPLLQGIFLQQMIKRGRFRVVFAHFRIEEIPSEARLYLCNCLHGSVPIKICDG